MCHANIILLLRLFNPKNYYFRKSRACYNWTYVTLGKWRVVVGGAIDVYPSRKV